MNTKRTFLLIFYLSITVIHSGFASEGPPPVLNPKTYASPSGVYMLSVDPTDLYGRGPADYRVAKNGKTVWENRLPYTLWEAVVTDEGQVAGYAYTHGWRGFSEKGWDDGPGEFIVAVLSAEGKTLQEEKHAREWSHFLHSPPNPLAKGTIIDTAGKRFGVRVNDPDINNRIEQWWVYDLASGKRISTLAPARAMPKLKDHESLFILDARAVSGTPLVLIHWWKYALGNCGGVFSLVDLDDAKAKPVWNFTLDGDYAVPNNEEAEDNIRTRIRCEGAILDLNKPLSFAVHAVKQRQRIVFSVEKSGDGSWQVRETARTPYEFPAAEANRQTPAFPRIELKELAAVRLRGTQGGKENPIRDIQSFGFDAEGRICVLSVARDAGPRLLYITQQGEVLKNLPLPVGKLPEVVDYSNPACVGGSKFVVTISDSKDDGKARCFVADFNAATVKELTDFDSFAIKALAGFPDGRFAALIYHRVKYSAAHGLSLFDAAGKPLWKKEDFGYSHKPEELLSPEDIARYGDESIAVLDVIRHTIQLFDTKGKYLRIIELNETWKREPSYPTNIVEDAQGGFAVYDFDAPMPLVRMDDKGRIKSQCAIKFSDGRPVGGRDLRRSLDGRLWTTDGDVLLRLSDDGKVDRILGEEEDIRAIHPSWEAAVGPNDRVYVADRRTHAVHVFNSAGETAGVCVPDATDLTEISDVGHIAVSADGNVFVSFFGSGNSYVRFDEKAKRIGRVRLDLKDVCQDWYFQPSGPLCWIRGYEDVYLVKNLGEVTRRISRRADRQWLESPSAIGVAPDGSAAVVAANRRGDVSISTYSPAGEPRKTFVGPPDWYRFGTVAYDGQSVYFQDHNTVYIINADNRCIGSFQLPSEGAENPWTGPFVAAEGKQLWFIDTEKLSLHKYSIPPQNQ